MKNGHCPMCNSTEVYCNSTVNFRAGGSLVDLEDETYFIPYVCFHCGFTALYVENMDDLRDMSEEEGWCRVKK